MAKELLKSDTHSDFTDFQSPHEASINRLVDALDRAYHRPGLLLWRSFWQGFMTAIGAIFGTLFISAMVVYLFNLLGGPELLRPYVDRFQAATEQTVTKPTGNLSNPNK